MMNDETEQFENRLRRQSLQKIPGEWRAEILAASRKTRTTHHSPLVTRHSFLSILNRQLSTIFWPHPKAWASLAAIWIFIFALNFSMRDKMPMIAEKMSPPSPEVVAELRQQKLMFAELIGANDLRDADRQKLFFPRPRTERAEILTA
jgi:hypothetical protein